MVLFSGFDVLVPQIRIIHQIVQDFRFRSRPVFQSLIERSRMVVQKSHVILAECFLLPKRIFASWPIVKYRPALRQYCAVRFGMFVSSCPGEFSYVSSFLQGHPFVVRFLAAKLLQSDPVRGADDWSVVLGLSICCRWYLCKWGGNSVIHKTKHTKLPRIDDISSWISCGTVVMRASFHFCCKLACSVSIWRSLSSVNSRHCCWVALLSARCRFVRKLELHSKLRTCQHENFNNKIC